MQKWGVRPQNDHVTLWAHHQTQSQSRMFLFVCLCLTKAAVVLNDVKSRGVLLWISALPHCGFTLWHCSHRTAGLSRLLWLTHQRCWWPVWVTSHDGPTAVHLLLHPHRWTDEQGWMSISDVTGLSSVQDECEPSRDDDYNRPSEGHWHTDIYCCITHTHTHTHHEVLLQMYFMSYNKRWTYFLNLCSKQTFFSGI